ncbi:MAG: GINS complex subunit, partial [Ramalina farinacea]|nr:GINS complex subunit [Ramalina farinacea]
IEVVEDQTGSPDPKANFRLIIIQTELERFKYLVRSFLRTRIAKIDAYLLHYTSSPEARAHLSAAELQYASTHVTLLHQHYHSSFLSQFPASLRNLDDKAAGGISMIDSPDMGKAVFARALRDMDGEVEVPGTDIRLAMERGAVVVARWSAVKDLVVNGFCELL